MQMQSWAIELQGRIARLLFYGSGGGGKTCVINMVFTKLFQRYFGSRGVVLSAFSNKAAWLIKGKSGHAPSDRSRLQASGAAELFLMTLAPTEGFQKACFQDFEFCSTRRLKPRMRQRKKL
jgi:GTPase SAR1 family protein